MKINNTCWRSDEKRILHFRLHGFLLMPMMSKLIICFLTFCFCFSASAQTYSSDMNDSNGLVFNEICPIGDLGHIQYIIDLRGFVPIAGVSKAKKEKQKSGLLNLVTTDVVTWYKIPTRWGIAILYYDNKDGWDSLKDTLSETRVLKENELSGENLKWAKFAYDLAKSSGKELFGASGGTWGFEAAEPVAVIFTAQSLIVLINFRYSDLDRDGTGQILSGFEFSRTLKEYKNFYQVYSTTMFRRSTKNALISSKPYITKALALYFSGS